MLISFHDVSEFQGRYDKFPKFIQGVIESSQARSVCEIGAGAHPALTKEFVEHHHIDYTALDAEASELSKASYQPKLVVWDICKAGELPANSFDLVFSRMSFEHFSDSAGAHRNIWKMLKPGGVAVHCFPTLYTLPFVVNWLIPERLSRFLLQLVTPRTDYYHHDKFPARYDLCRGPRPSQIKKLEALGFEVLEYRGYFGHRYYLNGKLKFLHRVEERKTRMLLKSPNPLFTSFATVVLQKRVPAHSGAAGLARTQFE
jgi:SAM-dependent methyltransferase